jgi:hypothetical protein
MLKKKAKHKHISDCLNEPNEAEEWCFLLRLEGFSNKVIHYEFVAVPHENDVSYSITTKFCRQVISVLNSEATSSSLQGHRLDELNKVILLALSDGPRSSLWQIVCRICLSRSIGYRRLVDSLHFTLIHLHWVSYKLSESQKVRQDKSSWVELSSRFNFMTFCCSSGIKDGKTKSPW